MKLRNDKYVPYAYSSQCKSREASDDPMEWEPTPHNYTRFASVASDTPLDDPMDWEPTVPEECVDDPMDWEPTLP